MSGFFSISFSTSISPGAYLSRSSGINFKKLSFDNRFAGDVFSKRDPPLMPFNFSIISFAVFIFAISLSSLTTIILRFGISSLGLSCFASKNGFNR